MSTGFEKKIVTLNVGGTSCQTTVKTLMKGSCKLSNLVQLGGKCIFVDRDFLQFNKVLSYLRSGVAPDNDDKLGWAEMQYWDIHDPIRRSIECPLMYDVRTIPNYSSILQYLLEWFDHECCGHVNTLTVEFHKKSDITPLNCIDVDASFLDVVGCDGHSIALPDEVFNLFIDWIQDDSVAQRCNRADFNAGPDVTEPFTLDGLFMFLEAVRKGCKVTQIDYHPKGKGYIQNIETTTTRAQLCLTIDIQELQLANTKRYLEDFDILSPKKKKPRTEEGQFTC